ncbi:hypothetical protein BTE77_06875 [Ensifer adhaerens]|nr:hypothetical protein BTE77_06875 [Ensifer adhaerens]
MLIHEQSNRGLTDRAAAAEIGVLQQTFSAWKKKDVVPRPNKYSDVAAFLRISMDMMQNLADEAQQGARTTTLPDLGAPIKGIGTEEYVALDKYASGFAKPAIGGTYAIRVRGRNFWVNPRLTPREGNTVLLIDETAGRIATWPVDHDGEAHVVVLAEMI